MEYIVMSLEEAKKVAKKDAIVLVAKQDLENTDCNIGFNPKKFGECISVLEEGSTIAKVCDDFVNQLRIFSEYQKDVINYEPRGSLNIILVGKN